MDEVRVLAQRTQDSTQEIENMIVRLQTNAHNAVIAMQTGQTTVQQSVEQAQQAGVALEKITQAVAKISDMNTLIASASGEQASVSTEMNNNLARAHSLSDENAEFIQQTFSQSEDLSSMANSLKKLVGQFKI
jgi:methyl-accepting chemotaxis protein